MFRFFPSNYVWDLSINLSIEMGAKMGEIQEMCGPLTEAAKAKDAEGTAAFRLTWVKKTSPWGARFQPVINLSVPETTC